MEPKLADAYENPRKLGWGRLPNLVTNFHERFPAPPRFYFPTASEHFGWVSGLGLTGRYETQLGKGAAAFEHFDAGYAHDKDNVVAPPPDQVPLSGDGDPVPPAPLDTLEH